MASNLFSFFKTAAIPQSYSNNESKFNLTNIVLQTTCIFWLLAKIISWKVWGAERLFPVVPPFNFLQAPALLHWILFFGSLLFLCVLIAKPANKIIPIALLIIELSSCLLDQNRWQPWEYQYIFIVAIFIINKKQTQNIIPCIGFIIVATYFYSGIGKLNPGFLYLVWDNMILTRFFKIKISIAHNPFLYYSGYLTGLFEMIAGIGLLLPKTQKISAVALMAMHIFVLIFIGPIGLQYNISIIPWNILMLLHVWLIFSNSTFTEINFTALWKNRNKLVLICWGILPLLNYVGCWDNYLSSKLYSGNLPVAIAQIKDSTERKLLSPYLDKKSKAMSTDSTVKLNLQNWAMMEMNVPPYPEMRVYRKIKTQWLAQHAGTSTSIFLFKSSGRKNIKVEE